MSAEKILVNSLKDFDQVKILPHGRAVWRVIGDPRWINDPEDQPAYWQVKLQSLSLTPSGRHPKPVSWRFTPQSYFRLVKPSVFR